MPPLNSAALAFADYDRDSQTLTVTFHNGQSYTHQDVPREVYEELLTAGSAGAYYNSRIKSIYS